MDKKYYWNGVPIKCVEFGSTYVSKNEKYPLYWYNYEVSKSEDGLANIKSIRITTDSNHTFVISNDFGEGEFKLLNGGGPNSLHRSLPDENFIIGDESTHPKSLNSNALFIRNRLANDYFEKNFPKEFSEMEALKESIKSTRP